MINPWDLTPSELLIWGIVAHLIADWLLQNEWMAVNKMKRRERTKYSIFKSDGPLPTPWYDRHPAAYVHSGIHLLFLIPVFGLLPAIMLAVTHLIIDCRTFVAWYSEEVIQQTQPSGKGFDIGADVRIWTDQVFHILMIAIAALFLGV